ncbi:MAG: F0F1 ATP synthase subunit delta, partial [Bacteroidaceae bacterium]|nr:F0F1 ATP synthase subunit delta [Bacteroidaceae bacterium]
MIQGSIAIRYARALYEEAKAQSVDGIIYENLKVLHANLKATPDLQVALVNPRISKDKKYQLLVTASGINLGNRIPADSVSSSDSYRSSLYTRFLRL